ncbi:hypothetical protein J7I84_16845 [Arthrobacter sp. ISL-85]|uniref:hypothetical protein n=1 Tax=Arthrobacter sp. ISL-85 TaxID=2819115 RepID=UPI001BEB030C|nr:hypothetical protein [Arthrobacter sp. ISL-85]MBT2568136.1 hypothetical protein [Arthrobacter sp. ISL-85]
MIIHDAGKPSEKRTKSRAILQSSSGTFDVDAPIYEGDTVEAPDPRGGTHEYYVERVDITDTNGATAFQGMSHITAAWGTKPQAPAPYGISSSHVYNAPVINIQGNRAQIAWGNDTVSQNSGATSTVAQGYEEIAKTVAAALQNLPAADLDEDDKEVATEAAERIRKEITANKPDSKVLRRGLATLKGTLRGLPSDSITGANAPAHDWAQSTLSALTGLSIPT